MKEGEVWLIKNRHVINVYDDKHLSFYEKFTVEGPSAFVVLEVFCLYKDPFSAFVMTAEGPGWIASRDDAYNNFKYSRVPDEET